MTCHQYGICEVIAQTSFHEQNSAGITKYWLFSQATDKSTLKVAVLHILTILGLDQFKISLGELSTYPSPNTTFCPKKEFKCQHLVRRGVGQAVSQNLIMIRFSTAKKVVSDSPGLVDFAIGLVIFVLNLPDGQVLFFEGNSNYRGIVINPANQKGFWGWLK